MLVVRWSEFGPWIGPKLRANSDRRGRTNGIEDIGEQSIHLRRRKWRQGPKGLERHRPVAQEKGPIEKQLRKTENDSVKSIKSSVRGGGAAVQRAAKRAVKRVSSSRPEANKTVNRAVKTTTNQPGATRAVKKAAKKTARRRLRKGPANGA